MKKVKFVEVEKDEMQGIEVDGYTDTWSAFDVKVIVDNKDVYYILENDEYGDETCYLIYDAGFDLAVCETYDDIETALEDEGII